MLHSFQGALPHLPLPSLDETVAKVGVTRRMLGERACRSKRLQRQTDCDDLRLSDLDETVSNVGPVRPF